MPPPIRIYTYYTTRNIKIVINIKFLLLIIIILSFSGGYNELFLELKIDKVYIWSSCGICFKSVGKAYNL